MAIVHNTFNDLYNNYNNNSINIRYNSANAIDIIVFNFVFYPFV